MSRLKIMRRPKESFMIGDDVKITIMEVNGNQVRLAIEAPKEIAVHREEIYNKIQKEKQS